MRLQFSHCLIEDLLQIHRFPVQLSQQSVLYYSLVTHRFATHCTTLEPDAHRHRERARFPPSTKSPDQTPVPAREVILRVKMVTTKLPKQNTHNTHKATTTTTRSGTTNSLSHSPSRTLPHFSVVSCLPLSFFFVPAATAAHLTGRSGKKFSICPAASSLRPAVAKLPGMDYVLHG